MSSFTGPELLAILAIGACASDPEVHLEITRVTNTKVTVQLCDPASTQPCKTKELFEAPDAIATTRSLDIFVDDGTPRLVVQFTTFATTNFCTQVAVTFDGPIDARITLPADPGTLATIEACDDSCIPGICE